MVHDMYEEMRGPRHDLAISTLLRSPYFSF